MPLKTMKVKEETHRKLLTITSQKQIELGRRVSMDEIIQKFLREGTINLDIPKDITEKLKRELKKRYGTESLEEGITKILEDWIKEKKGK